MKERTATMILSELAEEADGKYIYDSVLTGGRFRDTERNAQLVGKLVEGLSPEDREKLKDLSAEDIIHRFAAYRRPRPEKPTTRTRGPVTFSKSKTNE